MKNFTELYTRSDFDALKKVISKPNFNAFQVVSTNLHSHFITSALINGKETSANVEIFTLVEEYVLNVWQHALSVTLKKFPHYLDYKWVEENRHPIKRLVFDSEKRREAEDYFFRQFADLSNSGTIKVSEGIQIDQNNVTVRIDVGIITRSVESKVLSQLKGEQEHFAFKTKDVSFDYLEIQKFLSYFDNHILELLNMDECVNQISKLDAQFLEAAEYCNLNAALHYLDEGANVNAINEFGDTAVTIATQCACDTFHSLYNSEKNPTLLWDKDQKLINANGKAIDFINALLNRGAEINMYGHGGSSPLQITTYVGNHVLMKYLLENGADPNLPLDPYQQHSWMYSDVLQEIYPPPGCSGTHESIIEIIEKLLLDAGAR
jgi:hypothetical protein